MAAITSKGQWNRFAKRRDLILRNELKKAMLFAADQIAVRMRATTAFNDDTANLRASIGVFGPIKASKQSLNLKSNKKELVDITERAITITIPIGMEYAIHVDNITGFTLPALAIAPKFVKDALDAGLSNAVRKFTT